MNHEHRNAILRGVSCASDAHDAFGCRERFGDGLQAFDIFETISELGIPLAFKELDQLLGACIRLGESMVGLLVTSKRELHIQRFTAAHELGHFLLDHATGIDLEVGLPTASSRDSLEIEADSFASELLLPKWLIRPVAQRNGWWSKSALGQSSNIYQLSLRLAASYEATCRALAQHQFIDALQMESLLAIQPKKIKRAALGAVVLDDPWADVWILTGADTGTRLDAGPNDLFLLSQEEWAGASWNAQEATAASANGSLILPAPMADEHAFVALPRGRKARLEAVVCTMGTRKPGPNAALKQALH